MTGQQINLIRIVYFSRNGITVSDAEMSQKLDRILNVSRINNARDDVTGALMFNNGVFGQVLEGPSDAVENTFERIQMDDRHSEVTLLEIGSIVERGFSAWSMGFVGKTSLQIGLGDAVATSKFDISLLSGQDIYGTLHALMLKNELGVRVA
jgi:hypothetical protein